MTFVDNFLPLLIAGYLSLSTFPKRREAVKKLLEANLWISGEAALRSIEGALSEYEQKALRSENFIRLIQSKKAEAMEPKRQGFGREPGQWRNVETALAT